eukprot:g14800.t1
MGYSCRDIVWDYVRPSSSFINTGTYAPPSTPRVHAFAAVPRTEPADCETQPPVGGIGTDVCRGRRNPYRGGLGSFHLRFTYLREGGHQVSRSPGPGSYETRHLTGGALVKRPKTASPCFRRPGGRLQFEGGGAWHEETPLVSAERRGTVRGNVKAQPQHYSLSFRSKADRLVVNKPTGTTHEGLGPGCYDVSKDGKSVGVKTEKRVARSGCSGKGSTNQFLVDWRAYMKRPSKTTAKSLRSEKADVTAGSEQPLGIVEDGAPRGTAVVAPTLTSASNPPGQAAPEPPPPKSNPEYDTRASSTREASSRPSTGRSGEAAISAAIWRIQAKGSFASVLDVVERRSTESSRVSSRSGLGSLSDDLDVRPRRTSPGVGVPWNSNVAGPRNNSEGYRFSAGLAEQHATPPRARYKSFQPRPDLSLVGEVVEEAAPERPRLDPSVASLVAATATQEICLGAMSLVAATRLSDVVAGGGTGAGRPLVSREQ